MDIGYARVSSEGQNLARQEEMMKELGVEKLFVEKQSGKNTDRPMLNEMLLFMREGDRVIVESISRLARNTRDLLTLVDEFKAKNVDFVSLKENIDTKTATGKFILTVFGAIAELERNSIRQRQSEGIEIAKKNGIYKGRKPIESPDFERLYAEYSNGVITLNRALELSNLSKSSWYRRIRRLTKA